MRQAAVTHTFVRQLPDQLTPGMVYVSIEFALAAHLCCCGCGHEVVTPFGPDDWKLTFDGVSVSLSPSIGNWGLPCRSHYWIQRNQVRWALPAPRARSAPVGTPADPAPTGPRRDDAWPTAGREGLARRVVTLLRTKNRRTGR